jgi:hypothetical protein
MFQAPPKPTMEPRKSNLMSLLNDTQAEEPRRVETKKILPQLISWCPVDDCPRSMKIGRSPFVDNAMMMVHLHTMHPDKTENHQNSSAQHQTSVAPPPRRIVLDQYGNKYYGAFVDARASAVPPRAPLLESSTRPQPPQYDNALLVDPLERANVRPFFSDPRAGMKEQNAAGSGDTQTKKRLRASCDACSRAKVKCDKKRPTCHRCSNMGIDCTITYRPGRAKGLISTINAAPVTTTRWHSLDDEWPPFIDP